MKYIHLIIFVLIIYIFANVYLGNLLILIVLSGSMQPILNPGDIAIIKKSDINDIEIGDIITFKIGNNFITHRVIDKINGTIITKGDANEDVDDYNITEKNFYGKFVISIPYLGYVFNEIKHRNVLLYFLIIVLPSIYLMYIETKNILNYRPKYERIKEKLNRKSSRIIIKIKVKEFLLISLTLFLILYLILYINIFGLKEIVYVKDVINYRIISDGEALDDYVEKIPYIMPISWFLFICEIFGKYSKEIIFMLLYLTLIIIFKRFYMERFPRVLK